MNIATEQFGTNIRATVTTTVPNFVRASVVPLTLMLHFLQNTLQFSIVNAAIVIGSVCLLLALVSLTMIKDTFSKDLNYVEEL